MSIAIAADTGGTFTDVVALSDDGGALLTAKSLTTYDAPMRGLTNGLARAGVDPGQGRSLKFGTTLVINAFLQQKGARVAMLCTRGFRDTLEIRRGNRIVPFDLDYARHPALAPREMRHEVGERINSRGEVIAPLDPAEIEALADVLLAQGVEAVGVSFINAYLNDAHEALAAEILRRRLPGVYVTTGSSLTREWYEYERAATAAANAFVGPTLNSFLQDMQATMTGAGYRRSIYLMASNGGVFSVDEARRQPVQLVESGPVGGCIGAVAYARALGLDKVIAFDMGGTTAKCALIENGGFETRSPYYVGGVEKGFPIRGSVIDIIEVGAGGGSIASLDRQERLSVGPRSAGSTPGPACYGLGGQEPTITDANVWLGRIGEASFLGGEMALDRAASGAAIRDKVGAPLGYRDDETDRVAQGILDIGALTMGSAIAQITTERGLDPRDFTLFVFGGGGPLHGADLARRMRIPRVVVPPHPGVFSAIGMLLAEARCDEGQTFLRPLAEETLPEMFRDMAAMEAKAAARLPAAADDAPAASVERSAEMRFAGQRHALKTPLGDADTVEALRQAFLAAYRARFGLGEETAPIELVSLGVTVARRMDAFTPASIAAKASVADGPATEVFRDVFFEQAGARLPTQVLQRTALAPGFTRAGPLIVEEYGSSTIVGPRDQITVGALGELVLEVAS